MYRSLPPPATRHVCLLRLPIMQASPDLASLTAWLRASPRSHPRRRGPYSALRRARLRYRKGGSGTVVWQCHLSFLLFSAFFLFSLCALCVEDFGLDEFWFRSNISRLHTPPKKPPRPQHD